MNKGYKTKIDVEGEVAYKNISGFMEKIAFQKDNYKNGTIYFLDSTNESIVKADSKKKTIELTDKVEEWVFNSINDLNN